MFTITLAPLDSRPTLQVTVPVPLHVPCVGTDETKLIPDGRVSVTMTLFAGDGPVFVTTRRYVRLAKTVPGFGEAVFEIDRFALAAPDTINCADVLCCRLPLVAVTLRL